MRGVWRTRANGLTGLRLLAAPLLADAVLRETHGMALALFVFGVASDLLDGWLARRDGAASALGRLLDHGCDACFVVFGLAALAARGELTPWLAPLVALAFLQYALDSGALRGLPLRLSLLGRWNGVAYFILLGVPVVRDGLQLGWPPVHWVAFGGFALLATTLLSMLDRAAALLRKKLR